MRRLTSISVTLLMIVTSMAGCIQALEDVTEVLGCTEEGALNFDPNATSELEELCLYLENEVRFIAVMTDAMAADPSTYLLDPTSGVSGVRYSMTMEGVDAESGMSVSMETLSVIMVDLESQSMYNRSKISYMGMLDIDAEIVMSGTDIMVTNSLGGPMASEVGESGSMSSISRDMTPNFEEVVRVASMDLRSIMGMEDMMPGGMGFDDENDRPDEDDRSDDADGSDDEEPDWEDFEPYCYDRDGVIVVQAWDSDDSQQTMERECYEMGYEWVYSQEMEDELHEDYDSVPTEGTLPEGASVVISHDPEAGLQSMFANSTDENGVMSMVIHLHEDGSFHSYDMTLDSHDADVSMSFAYLSTDVISIPEIDFSIDRTATPISTEIETMMVCDNGDLVDVLSVMDGWWDCDDGSDESFVDDRDEYYYEAHWDFCEWDEYLGEDGYMEEEYLCWMEDLDDLSVTQIEELQDCEQSENGCETEVYCEEVSYGSWECAYYDIDINEDEEDGLDWWDYHWESYFDGHCEWEGNPDHGEDRWSCMEEITHSDWDNWWWYCELHDEDWFCTDHYGQDPDHEHSADNDNYYATDHDAEEICIWEDEDGVVHYDCDEDEADWGYPVVMHAHVVNQVYNAPIADFELRVLDCSEDDPDDDSDPEWDDCLVMMTFPLNGGEIDNVTVEYLDNDGDGMVSSGDASVVSYPSDFAHGYEIQPYDTWAEEYSADSALIGPELPGFGAFLSLIGLLGAALIGRRQEA
ncbi:MAG: PGF-CTERM sorting domain-containing protein [Candidatus Thalassarchaeaceae archaeon]|nr:PGF-CTERM sorting domain-containing protein [Candidatus Thalassarchaeaceae archaeon]